MLFVLENCRPFDLGEYARSHLDLRPSIIDLSDSQRYRPRKGGGFILLITKWVDRNFWRHLLEQSCIRSVKARFLEGRSCFAGKDGKLVLSTRLRCVRTSSFSNTSFWSSALNNHKM